MTPSGTGEGPPDRGRRDLAFDEDGTLVPAGPASGLRAWLGLAYALVVLALGATVWIGRAGAKAAGRRPAHLPEAEAEAAGQGPVPRPRIPAG